MAAVESTSHRVPIKKMLLLSNVMMLFGDLYPMWPADIFNSALVTTRTQTMPQPKKLDAKHSTKLMSLFYVDKTVLLWYHLSAALFVGRRHTIYAISFAHSFNFICQFEANCLRVIYEVQLIFSTLIAGIAQRNRCSDAHASGVCILDKSLDLFMTK